MPASKEDIVDAIRTADKEAERLAASLTEAAWSTGVYEQGWNASQVLCHLADGSQITPFLINLAKTPPKPLPPGAYFDLDAYNARQVAARQGKPLSEIMGELRSGHQLSIEAVRAAPDELIAQHFRAPWGSEGPLGDIILEAIDHDMTHLRDLAGAVE